MERIRVFTDGGAFLKENKMYDSVSSYRVYKDDELLNDKVELHIDKTNNHAEIYAIAKAMGEAVAYLEEAKPEKFIVEVYSDSLLCVNSLNAWIYSWINDARKRHGKDVKWREVQLFNSQGKEVANQELIKEAFDHKLTLRYHIKIYHINSHESQKNLKKLYNKFCKFNKCEMEYDDFLFAYLQNKKCDEVIKPFYDDYIQNNLVDNNNI